MYARNYVESFYMTIPSKIESKTGRLDTFSVIDGGIQSVHIGQEDLGHEYEENFDKYFKYAASLTFSHCNSYDVVQNVFARLVTRVKSDKGLVVESLEGYIMNAIRNESIDIFKKKSRRDSKLLSVLENTPSAELDHLEKLKNSELAQLIKQLPELQRVCIVMFYYESMKIDSIAKSLEIKPASVKTHLQRGRKALYLKVKAGSDE